ncbi:MAG: hypothetical protein RR408_09870, partial [Carnobacterium sp.]|uniref:hypothetical protein n=1 Tax=Carnobacterium sp. TaxID=48221 RepID=UPI002FCCA2AF
NKAIKASEIAFLLFKIRLSVLLSNSIRYFLSSAEFFCSLYPLVRIERAVSAAFLYPITLCEE